MRFMFTLFAAILIACGMFAVVGLLLNRQYTPAASVFCATVAFLALALIHEALSQIAKLAAKHLPQMAADLHDVGEAYRVAKAQADHARHQWEQQQAAMMNAPMPPRVPRQ